MAGAVVVASIVPIPGEAPFGRADVLAHAGAYLLLMSWFSALYPRSARPWIAGLLLLLGVALEVVQHSLGHRMFEIADIAANAVGIALGWRMGRRVVLRLLDKVEYLIGFD